MKKTTKAKMIMVCTLLLTLCLTGCGLFKSDTQKLTELLEDKYGEEFGVEEHHYEGDMWAMCYPLDDPTLLFQVRTDGEVTHIVHDYYLQNVVARQLEEKYEPLAQQAFPGSYLSVDISNTLASIPDDFPKADTVTLDDITQYCLTMDLSSDVVLNIFIDSTKLTEDNIEKEYEFLSDEIGSRVKENLLPDTIVMLYFGDTIFVKECTKTLSVTTWMDNDIHEVIKEYPQLWIWYYELGIPELGMNQGELTLDKYVEKRTEALNNE